MAGTTGVNPAAYRGYLHTAGRSLSCIWPKPYRQDATTYVVGTLRSKTNHAAFKTPNKWHSRDMQGLETTKGLHAA